MQQKKYFPHLKIYKVGDVVTYSSSIDRTRTGTSLQIEPTHRGIVGGTVPNHHIMIPENNKESEAEFL